MASYDFGNYSEDLARLTSKEALAAKRDPERMAEMLDAMAHAVGLTVAIAASGDARRIDELFAGFEAHAHARAVEMAPLLRLAAAGVPQ